MQGFFKSGMLNCCSRQTWIQLGFISDFITSFVISFLIVFSPLSFGTTEAWSIWTVNICSYLLGFALLLKFWIRRFMRRSTAGAIQSRRMMKWLFFCTVTISAYAFTSALNSKATYSARFGSFEYHRFWRWLPSSLDGRSSWQAVAMCLALVACFWCIWNWLEPGEPCTGRSPSRRLDALIGGLCIFGGALGAEAILQRDVGCPRLLFLVLPDVHREPIEQFGPFAYRATAAQYFNLLWPVCLGFATTMCPVRYGRRGTAVMLFCCAIMAACPFISSARGGALADAAMLVCVAAILVYRFAKRSQRLKPACSGWHVSMFYAVVLALSLGFGWKNLLPRLNTLREGLNGRQELYETGARMAADYPVFGTGPGTFEEVYQLYRSDARLYWPAQLHNDWLEIRVTWGWVGFALIATALLLVLLRPVVCWLSAPADQALTPYVYVAIAGCLLQARWDFPMQVYSIALIFVIWCAVLCLLPQTRTVR